MEYRRLGQTGVKVSRLCLGGAIRSTFDESQFINVVHHAIDLGCNFIDSANAYTIGRAEELLGQAIKGKRNDLVITSKVYSPMGPGPNDRGLSRVHIMREIENSLRRLQTNWIDLYYLHSVDLDTRFEETLRTLEDIVRQGKVRYVGASNYSPAQVVDLLWTADRLNLEPIVCLQNQYNLLRRWEVEGELAAVIKRYGLGLTTYSPLAIGLLSGRYRRGVTPPADGFWTAEHLQEMLGEQGDRIIQTLIQMAADRGATPAQLAIAWLLDHDNVSAPIVGADRIAYVDEVFGALEIKLTPEERQTLDAVSQWPTLAHYL